jgi:signal transduction histidine kinase
VVVAVGVLHANGATTDFSGSLPDRPIDGAGYALIVLTGGMLVVRRLWPLATLPVVVPLTAVYLGIGYPYGPILFSSSVAVYTVARHRAVAHAGLASLVAFLLLLVPLFTRDAVLHGVLGVLATSAWVIIPFSIGLTLRVVREAAERERAELIRQHVDHERLRVAHEVHDIVGHGLAAIRMQAEVALHVLSKKPDQAQVALSAISRTSGEALEELRATLETLGHSGSDPQGSAQSLLSRLEELRKRMTDAGAHVDIEHAGEERPLPTVVGLTGYRIVQESLTNMLRHGQPKIATVRVAFEPDAVAITVSNPLSLTGTPITSSGMGIAGMRNRVSALAGEFSAGPTPDHRFEVRARIPTSEFS